MNCPDKQLLHDLVDGELEKDQQSEVKGHIRLCSICKEQFLQILNVYNALNETVDNSPCPSLDILEKHANNSLAKDHADKVQEHIDFCSRCESYIMAIKMFQISSGY